MGTTHYSTLVYGYKETPELRKLREVKQEVELPLCTGDETHKIDRWRPPGFCPSCGAKVERLPRMVDRTASPGEHYSAPGLDDLQADDRYDRMVNNYVHEPSPNLGDSDVVLGVQLASYEARSTDGAFEIPEITPEQVMEVDRLLLHNGLTPGVGEVKVYLLVGGF